jgi:hypothetical protein
MAGEQYEVQVSRGGRWQLEGVSGDEKDATSEARRRLGQPGVEGVRVLKEARSRFGQPTIVFEQKGRVADGEVITLGPIDSPPPRCEKPGDLYGGSARQTMAKLFRSYSSKMNLTVSEVLHNPRELRRVMEKDNLVSSAVSRVASLQSSGESAQAAKTRRDDLFTMLDQVLARAYKAEKTELPSITTVGFAALEQAVALSAPDPEEAEYLKRVAISRELIEERSFLGKLGNAVTWVEGVEPDVAVGALDDFIADTLNDATLVQDLLGPRENLLAATLAGLDLLDGQMALAKGQEEARKEINATSERLNKLIGASRLPGAVEVIAERVRSMIASKNPLIRDGSPKDEKEALRKLVERLVPLDAPGRSSAELLDGLLERGARLLNMGGTAGRNEALTFLTDLLAEPPRKLRFLLAVYDSSLRPPLETRLVELIKRWAAEISTAAAVNPSTKNPALVMRAVTNLFYLVRDSALAAELKQQLTEHLDTLLYKYVVEAKILEMIDDPARPLRQRARMLMSMCLPDMLPPGKAVEAARPRVINYLRQPNFTTEVVADLTDPAERDKALRELFDLIRKAGFK